MKNIQKVLLILISFVFLIGGVQAFGFKNVSLVSDQDFNFGGSITIIDGNISNASLNDLRDVNVPSPLNGEVLTYNSTSNEWESINQSLIINFSAQNVNSSNFWDNLNTPTDINLTDLGNVNVPSPSDNEILSFNSSSQNWISQTFESLNTIWKSIGGIVSLKNPSDVFINGSFGIGVVPTHQFHILLNSTSNFFIDGRTNERTITLGAVRQEHTAGIAGTRAFHLDIKPNGFDDTRGITIRTDLKNSNSEIRVKGLNLDADVTGATNAHWNAIEVSKVGDVGSGMVLDALDVRGGVGVIDQHTGVPEVAEQNRIFDGSFTNETIAFGTTTTNVSIFVNDNDLIYFGDSQNFSSIEIILQNFSGNPGIKPLFEYSTGAGSWSVLDVSDNTNGFRESGLISFAIPDDWVNNTVDGSDARWVRIQRTSNNLDPIPVELQMRVIVETIFDWDASGNVFINSLTTLNGIQANGSFIVNTSLGFVGIGTTTPEQLLHLKGGVALIENTGSTASMLIDRTDGKIMSFTAGTGAGTIRFDNSGDFKIQKQSRANIEAGGSTGLVSIVTVESAPANSFFIDSAGDVGFGTASPNAKLDVRGNTIITGNLTIGGEADFLGNLNMNGNNITNVSYLFVSNITGNSPVRIIGKSGKTLVIFDENETGKIIVNSTITENLFDVDGQMGYLFKNNNNGTNASTLISLVNDAGNNITMGILGSNFDRVNGTNNSGFILLNSRSPLILANNFNQSISFMNNPSDDGDPTNLRKIVSIGESGIGLIIKKLIGQVTNLFEIRDENKTILLSVDSSGNLDMSGNFTGNQIYAGLLFHNDSLVTIDIPVAGVYIPMGIWNISLQDQNNSIVLNGFTFIDNSTIQAQVPGLYYVSQSISFESSPGAEMGSTVLVNNVSRHIHGHRSIKNANDVGNFGGEGFVRLNIGDNVSLGIQDETVSPSDADIKSADLNLMRMGNI